MPDLTYTVGTAEALHPDPEIASRMREIGIDNTCGYGCKVYADPESHLRVLAHNRSYGCTQPSTMWGQKARCYREFCCNEATYEVETLNRGIRADLEPIPWGWCAQHKHESWTVRSA